MHFLQNSQYFILWQWRVGWSCPGLWYCCISWYPDKQFSLTTQRETPDITCSVHNTCYWEANLTTNLKKNWGMYLTDLLCKMFTGQDRYILWMHQIPATTYLESWRKEWLFAEWWRFYVWTRGIAGGKSQCWENPNVSVEIAIVGRSLIGNGPDDRWRNEWMHGWSVKLERDNWMCTLMIMELMHWGNLMVRMFAQIRLLC